MAKALKLKTTKRRVKVKDLTAGEKKMSKKQMKRLEAARSNTVVLKPGTPVIPEEMCKRHFAS